jgi:hypothetical protein
LSNPGLFGDKAERIKINGDMGQGRKEKVKGWKKRQGGQR